MLHTRTVYAFTLRRNNERKNDYGLRISFLFFSSLAKCINSRCIRSIESVVLKIFITMRLFILIAFIGTLFTCVYGSLKGKKDPNLQDFETNLQSLISTGKIAEILNILKDNGILVSKTGSSMGTPGNGIENANKLKELSQLSAAAHQQVSATLQPPAQSTLVPTAPNQQPIHLPLAMHLASLPILPALETNAPPFANSYNRDLKQSATQPKVPTVISPHEALYYKVLDKAIEFLKQQNALTDVTIPLQHTQRPMLVATSQMSNSDKDKITSNVNPKLPIQDVNYMHKADSRNPSPSEGSKNVPISVQTNTNPDSSAHNPSSASRAVEATSDGHIPTPSDTHPRKPISVQPNMNSNGQPITNSYSNGATHEPFPDGRMRTSNDASPHSPNYTQANIASNAQEPSADGHNPLSSPTEVQPRRSIYNQSNTIPSDRNGPIHVQPNTNSDIQPKTKSNDVMHEPYADGHSASDAQPGALHEPISGGHTNDGQANKPMLIQPSTNSGSGAHEPSLDGHITNPSDSHNSAPSDAPHAPIFIQPITISNGAAHEPSSDGHTNDTQPYKPTPIQPNANSDGEAHELPSSGRNLTQSDAPHIPNYIQPNTNSVDAAQEPLPKRPIRYSIAHIPIVISLEHPNNFANKPTPNHNTLPNERIHLIHIHPITTFDDASPKLFRDVHNPSPSDANTQRPNMLPESPTDENKPVLLLHETSPNSITDDQKLPLPLNTIHDAAGFPIRGSADPVLNTQRQNKQKKKKPRVRYDPYSKHSKHFHPYIHHKPPVAIVGYA